MWAGTASRTRLYDFQRDCRLAQMKSAAATAQHLLHRAAEVDVDHIKAILDESQRGRREIRRIGAHQLPAGGMLFVRHVQEMPILAPRLQPDDELIEHHFAKRIRRTETAGDHAHRHIAVAGERRLNDGKIQKQRPNAKFAE